MIWCLRLVYSLNAQPALSCVSFLWAQPLLNGSQLDFVKVASGLLAFTFPTLFFLFGILFLFFMLLFLYFIYPYKPSAILSGMRWHINTYIDAYIKCMLRFERDIKHKCIPLGYWYSREWQGGKRKGSSNFQNIHHSVFFWSLSTPTPRFPGNMRIMVEGGFVSWKIQVFLMHLFASHSSTQSSEPHLQVFSALSLCLVSKQLSLPE